MAGDEEYVAYPVAREEVPDDQLSLDAAFDAACARLAKEHRALEGRVVAFYTTVVGASGAVSKAWAFEALSFVGFVTGRPGAASELLFCEERTYAGGWCAAAYIETVVAGTATVGGLRDAFCARVIDELRRRGRERS